MVIALAYTIAKTPQMEHLKFIIVCSYISIIKKRQLRIKEHIIFMGRND